MTYVSEGIRAGPASFCQVCATIAEAPIAELQEEEGEARRQEEAEAAQDTSGRGARRLPSPIRTAEQI